MCINFRLPVDWRGGWATPGVPDETLERGLLSEAAHQTPPGKRLVATEINLTLW